MTPTNDDDGLQAAVRAWGEAMFNEPREKTHPMATTDVEEVVKAQLTENTGTHFLDSGDPGVRRHWQQNEETPPWEEPAWDVRNGWVTHNVYDFLTSQFSRDRSCVALEAAMYSFGYNGPGEGEGWHPVSKMFADAITDRHLPMDEYLDMGLGEEFAEDLMGIHAQMIDANYRSGFGSDSGGMPEKMVFNTYNCSDDHPLSQVIQGVAPCGPHGDYVFIQVHQGADVRGGYTAPRVYKDAYGSILPMELEFSCEKCDWTGYESVLKRNDYPMLEFHPDEEHPESPDAYDGWIEHDPEHCGGIVYVH